MLKEFKEFIMRGNVIDLAVAVVIGAAFTAIVNSLVNDIITPGILSPIMAMLDVEDLSKLSWHGLKWGSFVAAVINFVIIGFVLFMIVRTLNKLQNLKKKEAAVEPVAEPVPTKEEQLLTEIRDLLKK